ncbi:MAG: SCP2 sterol-binding domain-containing protein [Granulosicoccaceae bacterium]
MIKKVCVLFICALISPVLFAAEFMDASWAALACKAWNNNDTLTQNLLRTSSRENSYSWMKNDADRGYKLIQIYRSNCGAKSAVQLNIAEQDGQAMCVYGGEPDGKNMNYSVDYVMHATDKNWTCMGTGDCGVMGSMMTRKLKFKGPKMEAMQVMGPFSAFLRLTGDIPGDKSECGT